MVSLRPKHCAAVSCQRQTLVTPTFALLGPRQHPPLLLLSSALVFPFVSPKLLLAANRPLFLFSYPTRKRLAAAADSPGPKKDICNSRVQDVACKTNEIYQSMLLSVSGPVHCLFQVGQHHSPPSMSNQSDISFCLGQSEDRNPIDPTSIYTMEEFIAEQSISHNFLERIFVKIQDKIEAKQTGTSRRQSRKYIKRNHEEGHQQLVADYFSEDPIYTDKLFWRRFRMRRPLFLRIVHALTEWSPYFTNRTDAFQRKGLSPLQKCTAAIRMLACGSVEDVVDHYVQIGVSTILDCLDHFLDGVIAKFGEEYLRSPTSVDNQRLLQVGEVRGFPGMLGSVGCMHWEWKNCPAKWKRHLTHTDHGVVKIILEVVASQDLWIWHAFFGLVGSNNDISVLNQSQLFTEVLKGQAPHVQFSVSERQYNMGYYLADEIYPDWTVFIKPTPRPQTEKDKLFSRHHEEARNDVQRALELLQSRFAIMRGPTRFFPKETLGKIMQACIILHNMTIEDEQDMASACFDSETSVDLPADMSNGPADCFADLIRRTATISAQSTQTQLRSDLIEHVCNH